MAKKSRTLRREKLNSPRRKFKKPKILTKLSERKTSKQPRKHRTTKNKTGRGMSVVSVLSTPTDHKKKQSSITLRSNGKARQHTRENEGSESPTNRKDQLLESIRNSINTITDMNDKVEQNTRNNKHTVDTMVFQIKQLETQIAKVAGELGLEFSKNAVNSYAMKTDKAINQWNFIASDSISKLNKASAQSIIMINHLTEMMAAISQHPNNTTRGNPLVHFAQTR